MLPDEVREAVEFAPLPAWLMTPAYQCCPACRGYRLDRQWCHLCKGNGIVRITAHLSENSRG